jgi:hypothetical protein
MYLAIGNIDLCKGKNRPPQLFGTCAKGYGQQKSHTLLHGFNIIRNGSFTKGTAFTSA